MDGRIDAIYARQSIDKADSISIESQIEYCKYETRGAPFQVFADKGYSGKNTERPDFQRLCMQIRQGVVGRVICYKLDRFSRSILDFASIMELLQAHQVEFVSCTEKFDTSTPMGRAMLNVCIVFAQLERETIQQRVSDAYHSRSLKGFYMGGRLPFGFSTEPFFLDGRKTSRYLINPDEARILRQMYSIYSDPLSNCGDVVRFLANARIQNPRSRDGSWIRNHIGRMLSNPIYVKADLAVYAYFQSLGTEICSDISLFAGTNGCYLFSRTNRDGPDQLIVAPHEGIVDADLWLQCRNKHTSHPSRRFGGYAKNSWLAGKVKCGLCSYAMVIRRSVKKSGKEYRYFACSKGCQNQNKYTLSFRAEDIEAAISEEIKRMLPVFIPRPRTEDPAVSQKTKDLNRRLLMTRDEIRKLADKAELSEDELLQCFNQKIRILKSREMALQSELNKLNRDTPPPGYSNARIPDWENMDLLQKKRIADLLILQIRLHTNIEICWKLNPHPESDAKENPTAE